MTTSKITAVLLLGAVLLAALQIYLTPANKTLDDNMRSTVRLETPLGDKAMTGAGVVVANGYVISAAHLINDGAKDLKGHDTTVYFFDASMRGFKVIDYNLESDIALLKGDTHNTVPANIRCSSPILGEEVASIGMPLGNPWVMFFGRVSKVHPQFEGVMKMLTHELQADTEFMVDIGIQSGSSGGGLFDQAGNLLGIASQTAVDEKDVRIRLSLFTNPDEICTMLQANNIDADLH